MNCYMTDFILNDEAQKWLNDKKSTTEKQRSKNEGKTKKYNRKEDENEGKRDGLVPLSCFI